MTWKRRDFIKVTAATIALGVRRAFPCGAFASADSDIAATAKQVYDPNAAEIGIGSPLYEFDPLKWLYIGCEGDHPKSWTFMGGGLAPGQLTRTIQYAVSVGNRTYCPDEASPTRKLDIKWYLRDGYLPCPVSEWKAGPLGVTIQHFAHRIPQASLTGVSSRVRLTNHSSTEQQVRLLVNAGPAVEVPLSSNPSGNGADHMYFDLRLKPGQSTTEDFVTISSGDPLEVLKLNQITNPGFESDPGPTATPLGWKTSGDHEASYTTGWNAPDYPFAEYGEIEVQHSGRLQLIQHGKSSYSVYTYQPVSNLADGVYDLRAWVRRIGNHKACKMVVKRYGGPDLELDITGDTYHPLTIRAIRVTTGQCEFGFRSEGDPSTYLCVDDLALYSADALNEGLTQLLKSAGGFDANYAEMARHYNQRIAALTHPVVLPVAGLTDMYKSIQIMIWESIVESGDNYEMRSGTRATWPSRVYSYDRTFTHDVPNFVDQHMREGAYDIGKKILNSPYYKVLNGITLETNYMDTIGKYMLPYAEYLQGTGDVAFFTSAIREELKTTARNIHVCRVFDDPEHFGLIKKGVDFENFVRPEGDYLVADSWGALHGLQAYKYICEKLGDAAEAQWATREMQDLNDCLNRALDRTCSRKKTEHYMGAFDDETLMLYTTSIYSWVPFSGALSTFPWGAYLKGFDLGGTWKDKFEASIKFVLDERDKLGIPSGSWGAWWGQVTYGTAYNASAGLQCLFSDKYRTEAIKNVEFQLENQCAPFQWSEAFESKGKDQWVGMYLPRGEGGYGGYECWGANFTKQALLQACVSVKTDGTVIIGRGIPNHWLKPGDVIEWANVNVNDNRRINFKIVGSKGEIALDIWGDSPNGLVELNLPALKGNIASASAGDIDNEKGIVSLKPGLNSAKVQLRNPI